MKFIVNTFLDYHFRQGKAGSSKSALDSSQNTLGEHSNNAFDDWNEHSEYLFKQSEKVMDNLFNKSRSWFKLQKLNNNDESEHLRCSESETLLNCEQNIRIRHTDIADPVEAEQQALLASADNKHEHELYEQEETTLLSSREDEQEDELLSSVGLLVPPQADREVF